MRPIWKGTISFGLVSIPVSLYPATRREELKFRLLWASDLSPVIPWDEVETSVKRKSGDGLNFGAADLIKRLEKRGDLFAPVLGLKQQLPRSL